MLAKKKVSILLSYGDQLPAVLKYDRSISSVHLPVAVLYTDTDLDDVSVVLESKPVNPASNLPPLYRGLGLSNSM